MGGQVDWVYAIGTLWVLATVFVGVLIWVHWRTH
jgi:hypothetical protein